MFSLLAVGEAGHPVAAVGRFHAALDLMNAYPNLVLLGGMTLPDASFRDVVTKFQPDLLIQGTHHEQASSH